MDRLARFIFSDFAAAHDLRGELSDLATGSKGLIPLGTRQYKPFKGLDVLGTGSRRLYPVGDTYGGLDDIAAQEGRGSLFTTLAEALVFCGHGQVSIEGTDIAGLIADNLLQIALKWNGSYTDANSGPFQVGLPEPSKPVVGILDTPVAGGTPSTNGLYSFKTARLRGATGGKSRASATSDVLLLVEKAAFIVLGAASDGQTIHVIFVTERGLGGVGLHLRLSRANPFTGLEYTEEDVERSVATLSMTNASAVVTDSADGFTAQDVGKLFRSGGAATTTPEADFDNVGGFITVTEADHGYETGVQGRYTTSNTLPTGIAAATDYNLYVIDEDTYLPCTSYANALAGIGIAFTNDGTGNHTFTPNITIPAGTTVESVDSDSQITLSNNVTVNHGANPRRGRLTAYVNETERCVSLNWTESDLAGEAAEISWIYDFPPPTCSHAFQLENRLGVATYADATADTSSTNPGTALLFSLSNELESFDIRFPLYLPEAVVDILGRGVDSYKFIGCRNGVYAVQYINADIPATISVILPNEGIENGNNWCVGRRGLYIMTARGKLVKVGEGGAIDDTFYDKIRLAIRDWEQADTVLAAETRSGGLTVSNGSTTYYYDEQTEKWSTELPLDEWNWFDGVAQVETNIVIAAAGITGSGNARSIITAAGFNGGSPLTVTVPVTTGAHTTATLIATAFRTALNANAIVTAFFTIGGTGATITLTARTSAANDGTMNFTIEDVSSAGITEDTSSDNTTAGQAIVKTSSAEVVSALGVRGRMVMTLEQAAARKVFEFDSGTGTNIVGISPYYAPEDETVMSVQEILARFIADQSTSDAYLCIHRNLQATHLRDLNITSGSSNAASASANFTSAHLGMYLLIQGADGWILRRIKAVTNTTTVVLGTPVEYFPSSVAEVVNEDIVTGYALLAYKVFPIDQSRTGTIQVKSPELLLNGCRSIAASLAIDTAGVDAQVLSIELRGEATDEDWGFDGAIWG